MILALVSVLFKVSYLNESHYSLFFLLDDLITFWSVFSTWSAKFVGQDEDVNFSGTQTVNTCEYGSEYYKAPEVVPHAMIDEKVMFV